MSSLKCIHISDIHLFSGKQNSILEKQTSLLGAIRNESLSDENVVVIYSGDLAQSGTSADFSVAKALMDEIKSAVGGVLVAEIIVPGNHDCILPESPDPIRELVLEKLLSSSSAMEKEEYLLQALSVQNDFFEFLLARKPELAMKLGKPADRIAWSETFLVAGKQICFNCINTAWMSTRYESQGTLLLPEQIHFPSADLVITSLHHPFRWLEANNSRELEKIIEQNSDLILTGHEHVPDQVEKRRKDNNAVVLSAPVLQEWGSDDQSGFRVFLVDLEEKRLSSRLYAFEEDAFRLVFDQESILADNRSIRPGFTNNREFSSELLDPGTEYTHPRIHKISLTDIFVWPDLRDRTPEIFDPSKFARVSGRNLPDYFVRHQKVIVTGPERCGKTSLCKALYLEMQTRGLVPLLIDGDDVRRTNPRKLENLLRRRVSKQYSETSPDLFLQLPAEARVVVVDNFEKSLQNPKGATKVLRKLEVYFDYVFLLGSEELIFDEILKPRDGSDVYWRYRELDILELNHVLRSALIERWHGLGGVEDEVLQGKVKLSTELVNTLLGKSILPAHPLFVLTILQTVETGSGHKESLGAYGYHYERLIYDALSKTLSDLAFVIPLGTVYTVASIIAYSAYSNDDARLTLEEFETIVANYASEYAMPISVDQLKRVLIDARLMRVIDDAIEFQYPYVFYYFVAKHFQGSLQSAKTRGAAKSELFTLVENIHLERNSNILIFTLYLTKDEEVIERIVIKAQKLFNYSDPKELNSPAFLKNLSRESIAVTIPKQSNGAEREKELTKIERARNNEDTLVDSSARPEDLPSQINVASKTLQVMGQVVRNFPGELDGATKLRVTKEAYLLGLRTLAGLLSQYDKDLSSFREFFTLREQENDPSLSPEKLDLRVSLLLQCLPLTLVQGFVTKVANSVGSQHLKETYKSVRTELTGPCVELIDLSIQLDHFVACPVTQIVRFHEQNRSNVFYQNVLRLMIARHLTLYQENQRIRDQLSEKLQIEMRTIKILGTTHKRFLN